MAAENHSVGDAKMINFLKNVLGVTIPEPLSVVPANSRLELLNNIIKAFHSHVPFQNIVLMSKVASERQLPTLEELTEDVISKLGGLCYTNNTFFKLALEALGYQVYHAACSVSLSNSHIVTSVRNVVQEGDLYVAEVGCGYPSFTAIRMDFDSESPTYKDSFCTYKLVKIDKPESNTAYSTYERWQKRDGTRPVPPIDERGEDWFRFYHFTLEPRTLEFFHRSIGELYEEATGLGPFHKTVTFTCFPGGQAVTLRSVNDSASETKSKWKLVLMDERAVSGIKKDQFDPEEEAEFALGMNHIKEMIPQLANHIEDAVQNLKVAVST